MSFEIYDRLLEEIQPFGAQLVAVSKTQPVSAILKMYEKGQRAFGENKPQEMVAKYNQMPKDIQWHLIGHLQTNKVKYVVPFVSLIHSVDSLKLLQEINKQAAKHNRVVDCLLQMYIAQEETKFGLSLRELTDLLGATELAALKNIRLCGLMGMASLTGNIQQIENEFSALKGVFDKIKQQYFSNTPHFKELSMGMSADYQMALKHGSTLIRIGSMLFGERNT